MTHLIEKIVNLDYNIRNGFSIFKGIDECYRLGLIETSKVELAQTVAELNNILNNK